jgi:CheY-like chemotaxis protein
LKKRVLDVGNCGPDFTAIERFLVDTFDCEVLQADDLAGALEALRAGPIDLVLVNRKLDLDYTDGIEIIRRLKSDPEWADVPVMLITNYAEHQDAAVQLGAKRGFGKLELGKRQTVERLHPFLQ